MSDLSPEEAITRARAATGVQQAVPARAWRVRRLDRTNDSYYLVVFGEDDAAVAVAAVGAAQGEIRSSASLPGHGPHLNVSMQEAAKRAGLGDAAQTELVWQPSAASRSPFYPVWEVRTPDRVVYVDQQGSVWPDLHAAGPGG